MGRKCFVWESIEAKIDVFESCRQGDGIKSMTLNKITKGVRADGGDTRLELSETPELGTREIQSMIL